MRAQQYRSVMSMQIVTAEPQGDGRYRAPVQLGMTGDWELLAIVTPPDGDAVQFRFVLTVGAT